jgi:hypothetical protein
MFLKNKKWKAITHSNWTQQLMWAPTMEGQPSDWIGPQRDTSLHLCGPHRMILSAQENPFTLLLHKKDYLYLSLFVKDWARI